MGFYDILHLLIYKCAKGRGEPPYKIDSAGVHTAGVDQNKEKEVRGIADGRS